MFQNVTQIGEQEFIIQGVNFVLVMMTAALSYRKPSSVMVRLPSCRAQRHYKRDICLHNLVSFPAALFLMHGLHCRIGSIPLQNLGHQT